MRRRKLIPVAIAIAVCCGMASSAYAGLLAYNDMVYPTTGGTDPSHPVNYYSIVDAGSSDPGATFFFDGTSGYLKDYNTALVTNVHVTISCSSVYRLWSSNAGGPAPAGSPGDPVFNGITGLDARGVLSYTTYDFNMAMEFSGLNPNSQYELVLYGARAGSSYWTRNSKFEITSAAGCVNTTPVPGTTTVYDASNPTYTQMCTGVNGSGSYGDIASFIITPNGDGTFTEVSWHGAWSGIGGSGKGYPEQVFRLTEIGGEVLIPEPAGLGLIGLALLGLRRRRS